MEQNKEVTWLMTKLPELLKMMSASLFGKPDWFDLLGSFSVGYCSWVKHSARSSSLNWLLSAVLGVDRWCGDRGVVSHDTCSASSFGSIDKISSCSFADCRQRTRQLTGRQRRPLLVVSLLQSSLAVLIKPNQCLWYQHSHLRCWFTQRQLKWVLNHLLRSRFKIFSVILWDSKVWENSRTSLNLTSGVPYSSRQCGILCLFNISIWRKLLPLPVSKRSSSEVK